MRSLAAARRAFNRLQRQAERKAAELAPPAPEFVAALAEWLPKVSPEYRWDWMHLACARRECERLADGANRKLIINMPPGHGKSKLVTIRFPVWLIHRRPTTQVIVGAYNETLAKKFSREARRLARGRIPLSRERNTALQWETPQGGGWRACGVGSPPTGERCDHLGMDDPIATREQAESPAYRERCAEWYEQELATRMRQTATACLIQTRWHMDDLTGRILAGEDGKSWTVLTLPAIAEANDPLGRAVGDVLCPELYDRADLEERQRITRSAWYALYQQRPVPKEGAMFRRDDFRYWEYDADRSHFILYRPGRPPEKVFVAHCWRLVVADTAGSAKDSACPTAITAWAITPDWDIIWLATFNERMVVGRVPSAVRDFWERWRGPGGQRTVLAVEAMGPSGVHTVQELQTQGIPVVPLSPQSAPKDSYVRVGAAQDYYSAGKVFHPRNAPWLAEAETQLLDFPAGKLVDIVDCVGYGAKLVEAEAVKRRPRKTHGAPAVQAVR